MHRYLIATAAALACCAPGTAWASRRSATVACGQTLTHSIRLANDLTNCPGAGLVVAADDVVVDLAGHTVSGTNSGDAGIDDLSGHGGISVLHGTVRNFTQGVALAHGARHNRVSDIAVTGADDAGVLVVESADNLIQDNRLSHVHNGIALFDSSGTLVQRNEINDTTGAGIEVAGASSDNAIANNRIARTFDVGIILAVFDDDPNVPPEFPSDNVVSGNSLADNSFGILLVEANAGRITANIVTRAGSFGDPGAPGGGIGLDGGNDNLLDHNVVTRSRGHGIQIGVDPDQDPHPIPPAGNRLRFNLANDNGADGIRISAMARATSLKHNVADHNAAFGIDAIGPVLDANGNTAEGNGEAAQCSGIVCNTVSPDRDHVAGGDARRA